MARRATVRVTRMFSSGGRLSSSSSGRRRSTRVQVVAVVLEVLLPVDLVELALGRQLGRRLALCRGFGPLLGRSRRRRPSTRPRCAVGSSTGFSRRACSSSSTGFSVSSWSTSASSSARDTWRILIACRSCGVITSCWRELLEDELVRLGRMPSFAKDDATAELLAEVDLARPAGSRRSRAGAALLEHRAVVQDVRAVADSQASRARCDR